MDYLKEKQMHEAINPLVGSAKLTETEKYNFDIRLWNGNEIMKYYFTLENARTTRNILTEMGFTFKISIDSHNLQTDRFTSTEINNNF